MPRPRLSNPLEVSLAAVARRTLLGHKVPLEDAAWISTAVIELFGLAPEAMYSTVDQSLDPCYWLEDLGQHWQTACGDRSLAVALLIDRFTVNCPAIQFPLPHTEQTPEQAAWVERLSRFVATSREHGIAFAAIFPKLVALRPGTASDAAFWMTWRFERLGALSAGEMVSPESVCKLGDRPDWWNYQRSYHEGERHDHYTDPTSLHLWLELKGAAAAKHLTSGLSELALDDFIRRARGVAYAFGVWPRMETPTHPESFAERGEEFAAVCRSVFEEAHRRVELSQSAPDDLRHVWLRFAWMAVDGSTDWVPPALRTELVRAAADDIGKLRPHLRRASPEDARVVAELDPHVRSCIFLLFKLGSLWQATKPLVLAFRATRARAIGYDLRYWNTGKPDDPPTPWKVFPRSLINMLHHYMRQEQQRDPELEALRAEFALFCLGRLKSRSRADGETLPGEAGLVEADPAWREGFVQAVRALRVNPKGKGHHVLNWTRQHDTDAGVREVAAEAHAELRHQPSLPKGMSPRRAVFDALWWLRQAHLASLGETMDRDGANRTREEEVRRTTQEAQRSK